MTPSASFPPGGSPRHDGPGRRRGHRRAVGRLPLLAAGLAVAVGACSDDDPVGPDPFDPDDEVLDMAPGEFRLITDPGDFQLNFREASGNEEYLIGIQSTSSSAGSLTPVQVSSEAAGDPGPQGDVPVAGSAAAETFGGGRDERLAPGGGEGLEALLQGGDPGQLQERWRQHHEAERAIRRQDRTLVQRASMSPAHRSLAEPAPGAAEPPIPAEVEVGDTVEIRIPDIDEDICEDFVSVNSVARAVGQHAVFLDDVDNDSDESFPEEAFQDLSDSYDEDIHPALVEHFGEFSDIDDNGRIGIVVSQAINEFERSVLGFVASVDFFPREAADGPSCPASNMGEVFYLRSPDGELGFDLERAEREVPRVLAHEATHLIQFGRRITQGNQLPTEWELEGQAVLGEEVAGHRATGREPRQNLSIQVAFNDGAEQVGDVAWYLNGFFDLFTYFGLVQVDGELDKVEGAPEECSWLERDVEDDHGAPCEFGGREPYGVAWSFLRWVSDHFHEDLPRGEEGFHQDLIDSGNLGFTNVENRVGEDREVLLAQWAASLYASGRLPEGGDPRIDMPSWNFAQIPTALVEEVRLLPRERTFSTFEDEVEVRGASTAYYLLSGANRPATSVEMTTLEDEPLPSPMQVWVVRMR